MKVFKLRILFTLILLVAVTLLVNGADKNIPGFVVKNNFTQLLVDNQPFLILGGETGNSAASDISEMNTWWPKIKNMNLNTILVPVYWELTEPVEGKFDFSLVDNMLKQARNHDIKLVLLWFGSWKNSMSCYAPAWVKRDDKRFPRTLDRNGQAAEILSAFSNQTLNADMKAFKALMAYLKTTDSEDRTVIMVQVENEIGQLPEARDYSAAANKAFRMDVPSQLIDYLKKNKSVLLPHIKDVWAKNGYRENGNWEAVFGKGLVTDEIFTAWHYAVFADKVAQAGKAAYNLPMFVNCALNRPHVDPGKYPSGGPLPHLINIWQAAAPNIDMLSPDIYHGDFRHWCQLYDVLGNPVFIPEIKLEEQNASQVFYVIGRHKSLGFSPFSIESAPDGVNNSLKKSYQIIDDLSEMILADPTKTNGVYLDKEHKTDTIEIGDYQIVVSHVFTLPWSDGAKAETWTQAGCIIIETQPGEFWIGGTSVVCTFRNIKKPALTTGLLSVDACKKDGNGWMYKRLNGDQTHQGRHMRISSGEWEIQRIRLYNYK